MTRRVSITDPGEDREGNNMSHLSRREFNALAAAAAVPFAFIRKPTTDAAPLTVQDVIDRIKKNIGVEWKA